MYRYDAYDQALVDQRARQFAGQVLRRKDGEIRELEFKPLRLQNGLYMQLHAYMLRINVPYGCLDTAQLRKLAHVARVYDKSYGHWTTRQNMQDLLVSLWRELEATVFFITHDISEAVYLGDRILVFSPSPGTIAHELQVAPPDRPAREMQQEPAFLESTRHVRSLLDKLESQNP